MGAQELRGQVWVLNVWASWCTACRLEHPLLVEFARTNTVALYGLNYKDAPADALRWLSQFGDPYRQSFSDRDGRVGMDFGVYGAPETFVIDQAGRVRFKHVGPLTPEVLQQQIVPLVRKLRA
jgi:cytochrome c biogenesis protein CcmG/thiol:disulfide interchange protein DsbE